LHDEIERVIDHRSHFRIRNPGAEFNRVPMLLVHMITWAHLLEAIPQFEREIGIAFQIRRCRNLIERHQRKHFAAYFENENRLAEGRSLSRAGFV
jgi:hypothetical protein